MISCQHGRYFEAWTARHHKLVQACPTISSLFDDCDKAVAEMRQEQMDSIAACGNYLARQTCDEQHHMVSAADIMVVYI